MNAKRFFLSLRITQFFFLFIIAGLEITQSLLFKKHNDNKSLETFGEYLEYYKQNGFKYFYYLVIGNTFMFSLYTFYTFTRQWKAGPQKKFICLEIIFLLIWIAVGFTNIYSMYYGNSQLNCNVVEEIQDIPGRITECRTYLGSMIMGWQEALVFLVTTIYLLNLWKQRDSVTDPNEKDQNQNEPEPHPDSTLV